MPNKTIIGVDMGGTNIGLGCVLDDKIIKHHAAEISAKGSKEEILNEIVKAISFIFNDDVAGIGVGVPSLVDVKKGIVYCVQNIPSWDEVYLKDFLEERFCKPVYVNNDANCFALGEKYFGKGRQFFNLIGLTLGTGLGAGIIINNHLYSGVNCGAGEFGSIPYRDHTFEYYCSGQFFEKEFGIKGECCYDNAVKGDSEALKIFREFGTHVGNVVHAILYSVDPEAIILGGSVSKAYDFFKETMWEKVNLFEYSHTVKNLLIEITTQPDIAILGAAALYYDAMEACLKNGH
ncbi:ROK family protein [Bacteroidota bacterium]